jgi:hypothetical protein
MTQSTELTSAGDDEQIRLEPDRHEMAAPARDCIERAFVRNLGQIPALRQRSRVASLMHQRAASCFWLR